MRNIYLVFILSSIAVLSLSLKENNRDDVCLSTSGERKSAGPPSCYAGEPPNYTTCNASGCHEDFALNSGTALLQLDLGNANNGYEPNQTYTVTISLSRNGMVRGGFELVVLQDDNITTTPGAIILTDAVRTQLVNAANPHSGGCPTQNKTWIEHTANGIDNIENNTISWQFNWQTPATDIGNVTFYLAAVDANKDLDCTGDYVYRLNKTISPLSTSVHELSNGNEISFYPNPVSDILSGTINNSFQNNQVEIISLEGKLLMKNIQVNGNHFNVDISSLASGLYFLQLNNGTQTIVKKFTKL